MRVVYSGIDTHCQNKIPCDASFFG